MSVHDNPPRAYIFDPPSHAHLLPYLAALHAACVAHDDMMDTFAPPIRQEELLAWWRERIAEAAARTRIILVLLAESQPGSPVQGRELMGAVMLGLAPGRAACHRAALEKLMVSPRYRRRGGGSVLVRQAEESALKMGRTLLILEATADSAAEWLFSKLQYTRVGAIPNYGRTSSGLIKGLVYFYKDMTHPTPAGSGKEDG